MLWLTVIFFKLFGFWIGFVDDVIVAFSVSGNLNGVKLDSGCWNEKKISFSPWALPSSNILFSLGKKLIYFLGTEMSACVALHTKYRVLLRVVLLTV